MGITVRENFTRRLTLLSTDLDRQVGNAMRRGARAIQRSAVEQYRRSGLGRALWGKSAAGGRASVRVGKLRKTDNAFRVEVYANGAAALIEEGGRTKAHVIRPKTGRVLAFQGREGRTYVGEVHHKGGPVPRNPALGPAAEKQAPLTTADLRKVIAFLSARAA